MQSTMWTGSGKAACRVGRNVVVGWWGAAARCMGTPQPDIMLILDESAKKPSDYTLDHVLD